LTQALDRLEERLPELNRQLAGAGQRYRELFPRFHNRRRAQSVLRAFPEQGLAAMRAGTDASSVALEIDAVGLEITAHRADLQRRFDEARSLAGLVSASCARRPHGSEAICAELAVQRARLEQMSAEAQTEFETVEAAYREASVDVPPGRRWLGNASDRDRR
jgi:hypothetical protein